MKKYGIQLICFLLIFSLGFGNGFIISNLCYEKKALENQLNGTVMEKDSILPVNEEMTIETKNEDSLLRLKKKIEKQLVSQDGIWAVYVEDLKTGEKMEINNRKMVSASLIKLFIMGKTYEEIEAGNIPEADVEKYLFDMITVSDNHSSNVLVAKLGGGQYTDMYQEPFQKGLAVVNAYAGSIACFDTEQQRDMMNARPKPVPEENFTSVADCGKFLGKLYRKELVSPQADEKMLGLLKQQTRKTKISLGLPYEVLSANKTGELSNVENDVAIVFGPETDYIICVMSNDVSNTAAAREKIGQISKTVYEFLN